MGTGNNGFPKDIVRKISENVINDFLSKNLSQMQVYLVITPDVAKGLSEKYGDYKLSTEERYAMYMSKYQSELKASGLSVDDYNRKRVDFYLHKYITNKASIINTIGWDKSSFSRFVSGVTLKPKRYKLINLAIQMHLDEEERFEFIHCVGYEYPVSERDKLIESKLVSGITDFFQLNDVLCDIDMKYDLTCPEQ